MLVGDPSSSVGTFVCPELSSSHRKAAVAGPVKAGIRSVAAFGAGASVYERACTSVRAVHEYLQFHYDATILRGPSATPDAPSSALQFAQRVAQKCAQHANPDRKHSALDVGCAVGGCSSSSRRTSPLLPASTSATRSPRPAWSCSRRVRRPTRPSSRARSFRSASRRCRAAACRSAVHFRRVTPATCKPARWWAGRRSTCENYEFCIYNEEFVFKMMTIAVRARCQSALPAAGSGGILASAGGADQQ